MSRPSYIIHHITRGEIVEIKAAARNDRDGPVSDESPSLTPREFWTECAAGLLGTVLICAFMFFASVLYVGN